MSTQVTPWSDIAKQLDPMMPKEQFDLMRDKYFHDVVAPNYDPKDRLHVYKDFMTKTERPKLLSSADEALLHAGEVGVSGTKRLIAPASILPGDVGEKARSAYHSLDYTEKEMDRLAARDGIPVEVTKMIGAGAGEVLPVVLTAGAAAPIVKAIASRAAQGVAGREIVRRTVEGSLSYGAYSAAAEVEGDRLTAGLQGAALGGVADGLFGIGHALVKKGAVPTAELGAEFARKAMRGEQIPPTVDKAMAEEVLKQAEVARIELRPRATTATAQDGPKGVFITMSDANGTLHNIKLMPEAEFRAIEEMELWMKKGFGVDNIQYHPENLTQHQRFMKMLEDRMASKYETKVVQTAPGQAQAVSASMAADGVQTKVIDEQTVLVQEKENSWMPSRPVGKKPEPALVQQHVNEFRDAKGNPMDEVDKDRFLSSFEEVWDPIAPAKDRAEAARFLISKGASDDLLPSLYKQKGGGYDHRTEESFYSDVLHDPFVMERSEAVLVKLANDYTEYAVPVWGSSRKAGTLEFPFKTEEDALAAASQLKGTHSKTGIELYPNPRAVQQGNTWEVQWGEEITDANYDRVFGYRTAIPESLRRDPLGPRPSQDAFDEATFQMTGEDIATLQGQMDILWDPKLPTDRKTLPLMIVREKLGDKFIPENMKGAAGAKLENRVTQLMKDFGFRTDNPEQVQAFREMLDEVGEAELIRTMEVSGASKGINVNKAGAIQEAARKGEIPSKRVDDPFGLGDDITIGTEAVDPGRRLEIQGGIAEEAREAVTSHYRSKGYSVIAAPAEDGTVTLIAWRRSDLDIERSFMARMPESERNILVSTPNGVMQVPRFAERPHRVGGFVDRATLTGITNENPPPMGLSFEPNAVSINGETSTKPLIMVRDDLPKDRVRDIVYHENMHGHMQMLGDDVVFKSIPHDAQKTAGMIATKIGEFPGYGGEKFTRLVDEAYTYAASAVRTGDEQMLRDLAQIDTSIDHVLDMVERTSENILARSMSHLDTPVQRMIQRKMNDLMRRSSSNRMWELRNAEKNLDVRFHYDHTAKLWAATDSAGNKTYFNNASEMWEWVGAHDASGFAPSASYAFELQGVRGPFVPRGGVPGKEARSLPDSPPSKDWKWLGWSSISGGIRPHLNWVATVHEKFNNEWGKKGRYMPLYERVKDVDDTVRQLDTFIQGAQERIVNVLGDIDHKTMPAMFDYLTIPPKKRSLELAKQHGLNEDQMMKAEEMYNWLEAMGDEHGFSVRKYLNEIVPQLRNFNYDYDFVLGKMDKKGKPSFWTEQIRTEQNIDPRDNHLGRFAHFVVNQAIQKKLKPGLGELQKLVDMQTKDGHYILGPTRWPLQNYVNYLKGIPDTSGQMINTLQRNFTDTLENKLKVMNEKLPDSMKLHPEQLKPPPALFNRLMILSYAAGLGLRPAIIARDLIQPFSTGLPIMGPTRFFNGMAHLTEEGFARAEKAGVILHKSNIGEAYGDIFQEIPAVGTRNLIDKATRMSNILLSPARWGNNIGRTIVFNGEYHAAVEWIGKYRAGQASAQDLLSNTSLWFADQPAISRLLEKAGSKSVTVEQAATDLAREIVDLTQWPLRRGTQPSLLRTGLGRIFGQYGSWPANYIDFLARMTKKIASNPKQAIPAVAAWGAVNFSAVSAFSSVGIEAEHWFFVSPAGYGGGPHLEFTQNLMQGFEETDKGREARKKVLEYPLSFVPGSVAVRNVLRGIDKGEMDGMGIPTGGPGWVRLMGFKPEDEPDMEMEQWLLNEVGMK